MLVKVSDFRVLSDFSIGYVNCDHVKMAEHFVCRTQFSLLGPPQCSRIPVGMLVNLEVWGFGDD